MENNIDCKCCKEIPAMETKVDELMNMETGERPQCITEHPGFGENCTAIWALQTAYITYRRSYGHDKCSTNE